MIRHGRGTERGVPGSVIVGVLLALIAGSVTAQSAVAAAVPCFEPEAKLGVGTDAPSKFAATAPNDAVAVGYDPDNYSSAAAVWVTRDRGTSWNRICTSTRAFHNRSGGMVVVDVAAAPNGVVVAVGFQGGYTDPVGRVPQAWRSPDAGLSWERVDIPKRLYERGELANPEMSAVAWTGKEFLAAGVDGDKPQRLAVWASHDGKRWERVGGDAAAGSTVRSLQEVEGIAVNDAGDVVIAGEFGRLLGTRHVVFWVRPTGERSWKRASVPGLRDSHPSKVTGVVVSGGDFVAAGYDQAGIGAQAFTSTDGGATWISSTEWSGDGRFAPEGIASSPDAGVVVIGTRCEADAPSDRCFTELWHRGPDGAWVSVPSVPSSDAISPTAIGVALGPPATYYLGGTVFFSREPGPHATSDNTDPVFHVGSL